MHVYTHLHTHKSLRKNLQNLNRWLAESGTLTDGAWLWEIGLRSHSLEVYALPVTPYAAWAW